MHNPIYPSLFTIQSSEWLIRPSLPMHVFPLVHFSLTHHISYCHNESCKSWWLLFHFCTSYIVLHWLHDHLDYTERVKNNTWRQILFHLLVKRQGTNKATITSYKFQEWKLPFSTAHAFPPLIEKKILKRFDCNSSPLPYVHFHQFSSSLANIHTMESNIGKLGSESSALILKYTQKVIRPLNNSYILSQFWMLWT